MRTYVNEPFVQRRAKLGQYLSWAGLGILGVGMVLMVGREGIDESQAILSRAGEDARVIGEIVEGDRKVVYQGVL